MNSSPGIMTTEEAKLFMDKHKVTEYNLVDVREDWEYEEFHIPGSRLFPLTELPDRLDELDPSKPTIVYCAVGSRSASAAQIMCGRDFKEVYNIFGGAMAWQDETAEGAYDFGLKYFTGSETPMEILAIAYSMEESLGHYYRQKASSALNSDLEEALLKLAGFEEGHKAKVYSMAKTLDNSIAGKEKFARMSGGSALEGGFEVLNVLEKEGKYLQSVRGILDLSMMFEAQALDLYMRCTEMDFNEDVLTVFRQLAEEEKTHIKILANLLRAEVKS